MKNRKKNNLGFSLTELVVSGTVAAGLVSVSLPKYRELYSQAKQVEAKANLKTIYTLQVPFYTENMRYAYVQATGAKLPRSKSNKDLITNCNVPNELGFRIADCRRVRYRYESENATSLSTKFRIRAISSYDANDPNDKNLIFPGCKIVDLWRVDQDRILTHRKAKNPESEGPRLIDPVQACY